MLKHPHKKHEGSAWVSIAAEVTGHKVRLWLPLLNTLQKMLA